VRAGVLNHAIKWETPHTLALWSRRESSCCCPAPTPQVNLTWTTRSPWKSQDVHSAQAR